MESKYTFEESAENVENVEKNDLIPSENENALFNAKEESEPQPDDMPISMDENLPEAEELERMLDERQYREVKRRIEEIPAADLAELFDDMAEKYYTRLYRLLPKEQAAEVFIEMDPDLQEYLINSFSDRELAETLDELYLDDTVDLIEEMPAGVVKRIIKNSSKEDRSLINQLLRYPKDSAGSIMTTEYVRLTETMTVAQALAHVRKVAIDKETIYTCYVTERDRRLVGIVTAKQMLLADPDTPLSEIMEDSFIYVSTTDDKEEVAMKFDKYGFIAMPVLDNEGRLVGIITVDDAMDVIKEEREEDFAKMAAITPTDTTYLKTSVPKIWLSRIPWLMLLMISATFSSTILGHFEKTLIPVLVLFVPMLMDTGGNSGSQSSVTVIRGISVGELQFSDLLRVLWKEICVGCLCGLSLGAVAFGKVMLVDRLLAGNTEVTVTVAVAVSVALAVTIIVAKIIGCLLPLCADKLGFDPAVMASPFITTIVDAVSLLLYSVIAVSFGLVLP